MFEIIIILVITLIQCFVFMKIMDYIHNKRN